MLTLNATRPPGPAGALLPRGGVVVSARRGVGVRVVVRAVVVFFGAARFPFGMHRQPHRSVSKQTPSSPVQSGLPAQSLVDLHLWVRPGVGSGFGSRQVCEGVVLGCGVVVSAGVRHMVVLLNQLLVDLRQVPSEPSLSSPTQSLSDWHGGARQLGLVVVAAVAALFFV